MSMVAMLVDFADIRERGQKRTNLGDFPPDTILPFYAVHVRAIFDEIDKDTARRMVLFDAQKQTAIEKLSQYRRTRAPGDSRFDIYLDHRFVKPNTAKGALSPLVKKTACCIKKATGKVNIVIDSLMKTHDPEHQLFRLPWVLSNTVAEDGAHGDCAGL